MSSTTLRVVAIGSTGRGDYGHSLGETFLHFDNTEMVAVADEDDAGRAAAAERMQAQRQYADYREMLEKERADIVTICPKWTDRRPDMMLRAIDSGVRGIFCEKPFAQTLADADAMLSACERNGVRVAVPHRRAAAHEMRLKEMVDAGEIGKLRVMRGHGKADHRAGSLDFMILGTHILDGMRYVAGSEVAWVHGHVTQDGRAVTKEDIHEGDEGVGLLAGNRVAAYYVFENGITAHYESMQGYPEDKNDHNSYLGFEVYGTKGMLSVRNEPGGELYLCRHDLWIPDPERHPWGKIEIPEWDNSTSAASTMGSNLLIVRELLAAMNEDREVRGVPTGYDARAAMEMVVGAHLSSRRGERVAFPVTERENPYVVWQSEA